MRTDKRVPIITLCAAVLYLLTGSVVHQFHTHCSSKSCDPSNAFGTVSISISHGDGGVRVQTSCLACYYVSSLQSPFPSLPSIVSMELVVLPFHGTGQAYPKKVITPDWLVRAPPAISPVDTTGV